MDRQIQLMIYKEFDVRQTQDTSVESFKEVCDSGLREKQYSKIKKALAGMEMNNNEIVLATGIKISSVTARVNELRKKGEIVLVGKKRDTNTNRMCMVWRLVE